jgi:hypothetical protein
VSSVCTKNWLSRCSWFSGSHGGERLPQLLLTIISWLQSHHPKGNIQATWVTCFLQLWDVLPCVMLLSMTGFLQRSCSTIFLMFKVLSYIDKVYWFFSPILTAFIFRFDRLLIFYIVHGKGQGLFIYFFHLYCILTFSFLKRHFVWVCNTMLNVL